MKENPHGDLQTGQTTCHDSDGAAISCRGSGQDGEFRRGIAWPEPRFDALGERVLDRLTGLTWMRNATPGELPMMWQEALAFVAALNRERALGFSDWRLPNRRELRSLVSHQTRRPALSEPNPFANVFAGWYWSATSAAGTPAHAWYVDMDGGRMFYGGKDQSFLVWPVRGESRVLPATGQVLCYSDKGAVIPCRGSGQDGELRMGVVWPEPRFSVLGEAVTDRLTGLVWRRAGHRAPEGMTWLDALAAVARLNRDDAAGWRLPNINELESLVDCAAANPALPSDHPFTGMREVYWSSTTSLYEPDWAWALYLDKGAVGVGQKRQARFHCWPVKDTPG
ncbi:MAG: Lcl C-terminal domain-containing protein [Thiobacillus sp.]